MKTQKIPYIFGGDGATLCIPSSKKDDAATALLSIQSLAKKEFSLILRTGIKFSIISNSFFFLLGGGIISIKKNPPIKIGGDHTRQVNPPWNCLRIPDRSSSHPNLLISIFL